MEGYQNTMNDMELAKIIGKPIRIIGIGGTGFNVLEIICDNIPEHACCIQIDTSVQMRSTCKCLFVQIGRIIQHGLGTGANPDLGEAAAIESEEDIRQILHGAKKVIITCGMGQGTGNGASRVIAKIAKEMGITVVGVVATPFLKEGEKRVQRSQEGIEKLKDSLSSLTIISTEQILQQLGTGSRLKELFNVCNRAMCDAIYNSCIFEIVAEGVLKNAMRMYIIMHMTYDSLYP